MLLYVTQSGILHVGLVNQGVRLTLCGYYDVHVNGERARQAGGKNPIRFESEHMGLESEVSCVLCKHKMQHEWWMT